MAVKFTYSDSEIKAIIEKYTSGVSIEVLADEYSKSVASIRMKLVKLGVYKAKTPAKVGSTSTKAAKAETLNLFNTCLANVGIATF